MTEVPNPSSQQSPSKFGYHNFPFGKFLKVSDFITGGLLAANWIYPIYHLKKLPEVLPMQYSFTGAVNWSGNKNLIFLLPIGATIALIASYYKAEKVKPEKVLYPLEVPKEQPERVGILAKYLTKLLGIVTQGCVLAGAVLLVKGPSVSQAIRGKWIKAGLAVGLLSVLASYAETHYFLKN